MEQFIVFVKEQPSVVCIGLYVILIPFMAEGINWLLNKVSDYMFWRENLKPHGIKWNGKW